MNDNKWGEQLKTNFNAGAGVSVSIPIFDQRSKKTALNKANIQKENALLDLKNEQTNLWATIEEYWLQATTNQNRFRSAQESTKSAKESYELLSEQFKLGLKNIVELRNGKDKLLQAEQSELESKYMTILNIDMLKFYQNGTLK
jgi:outer membrane protein